MSAPLRVWSLLAYLTTTEGLTWRDADYTPYKIVKALKGEPIKGYFKVSINGQAKTFDQTNISEFMPILFQAVAGKLGSLAAGAVDIVPIPNSSAVVGDKAEFNTLSHARAVAATLKGRATPLPALRWKAAKVPAHKGGSRDPQLHFQNLQIVERPTHQVVLFDDVMTSGSQMIGAYRRFVASGIKPAIAIAIGRTVHEQREKMIEWGYEDVETEEIVIDLDDIF